MAALRLSSWKMVDALHRFGQPLVLSSLALLLVTVAGCASVPNAPLAGTSGPISWSLENVTVEEDPFTGRLKWRFMVRVRDVSGSGVHFTKAYYGVSGQRLTPSEVTRDVSLELNAGAEAEFPCSTVVYFGTSGGSHPYDVRYKRVYSGVDDRGKPIQTTVEFDLNRSVPRGQPRLLEFARLTAHSAGNAALFCEAIPREVKSFDPARNDSVHLLIAIDNVRRAVPVRTRWLSPDGEEVKLIDGTIRADNFTAATSFVHVTHTLSTSVMRARPGSWKVELFLDGKLDSTYSFEIASSSPAPSPRRL